MVTVGPDDTRVPNEDPVGDDPEEQQRKKYIVHTLKELREIAADLNCDLVEAAPNELLCDLDRYAGSDAGFVFWRDERREILALIDEKFDITGFEHWASRNDRLHVKVLLERPLYKGAAIALQALLDSDATREVLAAFEAVHNVEEDTRSLFKPRPIPKTAEGA